MKRNIFIRIVCLLLCVSMITPIGASAAHTPPVKTTNKMYYVDQFFNHDGTDTDLRRALDHWLDMTTKGDQDAERQDSGYLMLEQEMVHQKELFGDYWAADALNTYVQPVAQFIASGGTSLVLSLIEEGVFMSKFGWAGESAYPYYLYLCEIYIEYVAAVQDMVDETDSVIKNVCDSIEFVDEMVGNRNVWVGKTKSNIWILNSKGKNGRGKPKDPGVTYTVTGVNSITNQLKVQVTAGVGEEFISPWEVVAGPTDNREFIKFVAAPNLSNAEHEEFNRIMKSKVKNKKYNSQETIEVFCGMPVEHAEGFVKALEGTGEDENALTEAKKSLKTKNTVINVPNTVKAAGKIAEYVGKINSTYQYIKNAENVTVQQMCYMNALTTVTPQYLDMLSQWRDQTAKSDASDKSDIMSAMDVLMENIVELGKTSAEELAKENQRVFTSGEFISLVVDWAEGISGIKGIANLLNAVRASAAGVAKDALNKLGSVGKKLANANWGRGVILAAVTSTAISFASNLTGFESFKKSTNAVTNLKKSLSYLLTNNTDGLLKQYIEDRSDANADAVINALNTMKAVKMVGEKLWEDQYLRKSYGLIGPLKGKTSAAVHLVFQNELINREKVTDFDISKSIIPIIAVYKDRLSLVSQNYGSYYTYTNDPIILGYYSYTEGHSYKGREIEKPPKFVESSNGRNLGEFSFSKEALQQILDDDKLLAQVSKSWNVEVEKIKNMKPNTSYMSFDALPREAAPFQSVKLNSLPQLSKSWESGEEIELIQKYAKLEPQRFMYTTDVSPSQMGHTMYIDDQQYLYSCDGLEVILTDEEYKQYQELVKKVTDLWDSGVGDEDDISWPAFRPGTYIEQQTPRIMLRTFQTREWINSFEMYDASVDYSKHKVKHGIIPN